MILFIWSIYVIITGKYQLAKHYGVTDGAARFCGAFNLLVSLGVIAAIIPIRDPLFSLGVQFALIIGVGFLAVTIKGNDFKKPESSEESVQTKLQVTKVAAVTRTIFAFIGYFLLSFMIVMFAVSQVLDANGIASIPDISNAAMRWGVWITIVIIPAVAAFFLSRRLYRRFDII